MIARGDSRISRRRRLILAFLLLAAIAPGTLLRTSLPETQVDILSVTPVDGPPGAVEVSGFRRVGLWELDSPNIDFGGYSALLVPGERGLLRSFSDRGTMVTFGIPGTESEGEVDFAQVTDRAELGRFIPDIESATSNPDSGDYWLGFEGRHAVISYSADGTRLALREPTEWVGWPENSGAEAMARLADGRFLVLPEGRRQGLLHPGDPTHGEPALQFAFTLPGDYAATDLAPLPDGRVLVLLRRVTWAYPPFSAALGVADPAGLKQGDTLVVEQVLDLDALLPRENYEGLAVEETADGSLTVWIIADDNLASFQRTLLARLTWTAPAPAAQAKARED
ncbi:MAG: esterase-like activity of phytase family protein [Erythrobacter sp.]|nr:MAG: esterase-like activity of phytase family protein [Erythrobacter sp.]